MNWGDTRDTKESTGNMLNEDDCAWHKKNSIYRKSASGYPCGITFSSPKLLWWAAVIKLWPLPVMMAGYRYGYLTAAWRSA